MDRERLEAELAAAFDGDERARHTVSRQTRDLADSGRIETDFDYELTVDAVVGHLRDAPDDCSLVERWNWWLGSLEFAEGGYHRFRIRPDLA